MANNHRFIQPVFGISAVRRHSSEILDAAETLVENLDNLADILDEITAKYETPTEKHTADDTKPTNQPQSESEEVCTRTKEPSLFKKLQTGLDSARSLINSLRREKGRLMKREMSVEMRMDEMAEYKGHIKQDMTSLNDTVDVLSVRVCQLEDALCEQEEIRERLEAEKAEMTESMNIAEQLCTELAEDKDENTAELQTLKRQRSDAGLRLENRELTMEIEVLLEENARLKEMVRKMDDQEVTSEGDCGTCLPALIESKINNNNTVLAANLECNVNESINNHK